MCDDLDDLDDALTARRPGRTPLTATAKAALRASIEAAPPMSETQRFRLAQLLRHAGAFTPPHATGDDRGIETR